MTAALFDDLQAWLESSRDMGRDALVHEQREMMYGARMSAAVPLQDALDILDRTVDNILGRALSLKERSDLGEGRTVPIESLLDPDDYAVMAMEDDD